jgi:hypothetical protein
VLQGCERISILGIFIVVISMCRMLFDRYSASLELGSPMLILGFKSDVALTN